MKKKLKKFYEYEDDRIRIIILGDVATQGKEYAEGTVIYKDKK